MSSSVQTGGAWSVCVVLFVGQLHVEAHRSRGPGKGPLVGRFHQPRAAARDDGEARVGELARQRLGFLVPAVVGLDAGAAEDRDGRADVRERLGGLDELCDARVC